MAHEWIEKRLEELKKTKTGLAAALGVAPPRINEIVGGGRKVQVEELHILAHYLQLSTIEVVNALTSEQDVTGDWVTVSVKGAVEAGQWNADAQWPVQEWYPIPMPIPERYRKFKSFGLEVRGYSMDEVYPPGTTLLCVSLQELNREAESGERVVVERHNRAGDVETTVKEYHKGPSGERWLMPRSTRPEHRAPLALAQHDTESVVVVAVVIGSFRPEGR